MFDNKTIGERFKDLRKSKKDKYGKDMPIFQLAQELLDKKYIGNYSADVIRQEIGKVENKGKFPQLFLIEGYSKYFKVTSDYLLGIRETKTVDENIAMISKITGLSNDAIEMLKILSKYRAEYQAIMPGLGSDIDAINAILEYQYYYTKKAEEKGGIPGWSIFHYIKQYLSSGIFERELQDRLRICDGNVWVDIEKGDILQKGDKHYKVINSESINSKTGSGNNSKTLHIVNTQNHKDRYVIEIDKIFSSYSKDNIFRELDKIKAYLETTIKGSD